MNRIPGWMACISLLLAGHASAHYHILLPDKASADRDTSVRFMLRFGHPFEHQMFASRKPVTVTVVTPAGKSLDLSGKVEKDASEAFRWDYAPAERGDHI